MSVLKTQNKLNMILNESDPKSGFKLKNQPNKGPQNFILENTCDPQISYAQFSTRISKQNENILEIRSRFSCGTI